MADPKKSKSPSNQNINFILKAIKDTYGDDISQKAINNILANIEIETGFRDLREKAYSWDNIQSNKNLVTARKNLKKWGKTKDDYNDLSHGEKLSVMYFGDTDHADVAGGTGVLQLTSANYGGNSNTAKDIRKAAKKLGIDSSKLADNFYDSTRLTLEVYKDRGIDFEKYDSPEDLRSKVINSGESLTSQKQETLRKDYTDQYKTYLEKKDEVDKIIANEKWKNSEEGKQAEKYGYYNLEDFNQAVESGEFNTKTIASKETLDRVNSQIHQSVAESTSPNNVIRPSSILSPTDVVTPSSELTPNAFKLLQEDAQPMQKIESKPELNKMKLGGFLKKSLPAIGAAAGSVIPGVGTAIGGAAGTMASALIEEDVPQIPEMDFERQGTSSNTARLTGEQAKTSTPDIKANGGPIKEGDPDPDLPPMTAKDSTDVATRSKQILDYIANSDKYRIRKRIQDKDALKRLDSEAKATSQVPIPNHYRFKPNREAQSPGDPFQYFQDPIGSYLDKNEDIPKPLYDKRAVPSETLLLDSSDGRAKEVPLYTGAEWDKYVEKKAYGGKARKSVKDPKIFIGPRHEQGGISIGNNTEVEGGEVKWKNYIFSDRY